MSEKPVHFETDMVPQLLGGQKDYQGRREGLGCQQLTTQDGSLGCQQLAVVFTQGPAEVGRCRSRRVLAFPTMQLAFGGWLCSEGSPCTLHHSLHPSYVLHIPGRMEARTLPSCWPGTRAWQGWRWEGVRVTHSVFLPALPPTAVCAARGWVVHETWGRSFLHGQMAVSAGSRASDLHLTVPRESA